MKTQLSLTGSYPSIYNLHFLGICLTLITACSVFKEKSFFQTDSLQRQESRREIKSGETVQSRAVRIYSLDDSSDKRSFTEIIPEGLFSYSSERGFSGNAKRLVINERVQNGSKLRDSAGLRQNSQKVSDLRESEDLLTRTRVKEKAVNTRNYNLWYWFGLLLIFGGVYMFRGRLKG